jgi:hypothetical protein
MPPATEAQDRAKRRADCDPEGEPPVKKFGLLQLGIVSNYGVLSVEQGPVVY